MGQLHWPFPSKREAPSMPDLLSVERCISQQKGNEGEDVLLCLTLPGYKSVQFSCPVNNLQTHELMLSSVQLLTMFIIRESGV